MGVKISHDDVVITGVEKKVKLWYEIGGTAGDKAAVNGVNVDVDIVDGGCNGEVLSDWVIGEEGVGEEMDGVMNEGDKSTSTVLMDSGVVWESVGWQVFGWFKFGFLYTCCKDVFRVEKGR